jgi:hypothetical protein
LRENVGGDDGRGRRILGFTVCETLGHAEPLDVAADVAPRIEGDDELGVEANDFEANDDKLDNESGCRVPHARQSCAIAPPSHAGVKTR